MYQERKMSGKKFLVAVSLYVCYTSALSQSVSEDDYARTKLSHCTAHLYRLILCIADDKPIIFEIRKCDNILAQTALCLASNRLENPLALLTHETEGNGVMNVIKRGLGRCIHKCLNGQGRMNFIQCKSMCHR